MGRYHVVMKWCVLVCCLGLACVDASPLTTTIATTSLDVTGIQANNNNNNNNTNNSNNNNNTASDVSLARILDTSVATAHQWLKARPELSTTVKYCIEHNATCDIEGVMATLTSSFINHANPVIDQLVASNVLSEPKLSGAFPDATLMTGLKRVFAEYSGVVSKPHAQHGGTRPIPYMTTGFGTGTTLTYGTFAVDEKKSEMVIMLWYSVFLLLAAISNNNIDVSTVGPETQTVLETFSRGLGDVLVLGEPFDSKVVRWRAIHSAFPSFAVWKSVYSNPRAGLGHYGGTSRICIDWLPFMFKSYNDNRVVDDFLREENWADTMDIFHPNQYLPSVKSAKEGGGYEAMVDALNDKEVGVKQHFVPGDDTQDAKALRSRMRRVFDMLDGRQGSVDTHAGEYQLPEEDLLACWDIMETALQTAGATAIRRQTSQLFNFRKYILYMTHGVVGILSLIMVALTASRLSKGDWVECPPPAVQWKDLTPDQYYCSQENLQGSVCWLSCSGRFQNPIDSDGRYAQDWSVCTDQKMWSHKLACADSSVWHNPYE